MALQDEALNDLDSVIEKARASAPTGISPKHLVNMGVFGAIYFMLAFACGMLGIVSPPMMFVGFVLSLILNGTVVMLYLVKTPVFGALTVLGVITAIPMVVMGHVWYIVVVAAILGLLGDLIVRSGEYRSRWRNILAYALFSTWGLAPWGPMITDREAYLAHVAQQMGEEYTRAMADLISTPLLVGWGVCLFLFGLLGAWIGSKVLTKHFAAAGII